MKSPTHDVINISVSSFLFDDKGDIIPSDFSIVSLELLDDNKNKSSISLAMPHVAAGHLLSAYGAYHNDRLNQKSLQA